MKSLLIASLLFASQSFAAELHLGAGESVLIAPNTTTQVFCAGNGGSPTGADCSAEANKLQKLVAACETGYTQTYCADKYILPLMKKIPSCSSRFFDLCTQKCETGYTRAFCADHCNP